MDAARCPAAVEAAAYFVCAEALTNVAKYARASRVRIEVQRDAGRLVVADRRRRRGRRRPGRGSGLRGLADRVEALGGWLSVDSPPRGRHPGRRRDPGSVRRAAGRPRVGIAAGQGAFPIRRHGLASIGAGETLPATGASVSWSRYRLQRKSHTSPGLVLALAAGAAVKVSVSVSPATVYVPAAEVARRLLLREAPAIEDHLRAAVVLGVDLALGAPAARRSSGVVCDAVDAVDRRGLAARRCCASRALEQAGASGGDGRCRSAWPGSARSRPWSARRARAGRRRAAPRDAAPPGRLCRP